MTIRRAWSGHHHPTAIEPLTGAARRATRRASLLR
jgi:hypothetical protein